MKATDQAAKLRELVGKGEASVSPKLSRLKSIAITSGKGGVGKSTLSIALAGAISFLGKKVLLLDGDFGLANLHILLGIAPRYNLSHAAKGECSLTDIISDGPGGIKIIPGASGVISLAETNPAIVSKIIEGLSAIEDQFDYLIIDGGAGISPASVKLTLSSDQAVIVVTPEPTSLADAYAVIKQCVAKGFKTIAIIVNMAESEAEGLDAYRKLAGMAQKYLGFEPLYLGAVPYDRGVSRLIKSQKNFLFDNPDSKMSVRVSAIARTLCGVKPLDDVGFFKKIFRKSSF